MTIFSIDMNSQIHHYNWGHVINNRTSDQISWDLTSCDIHIFQVREQWSYGRTVKIKLSKFCADRVDDFYENKFLNTRLSEYQMFALFGMKEMQKSKLLWEQFWIDSILLFNIAILLDYIHSLDAASHILPNFFSIQLFLLVREQKVLPWIVEN